MLPCLGTLDASCDWYFALFTISTFVTTITYSTLTRLHSLQTLHSNLFTLSAADLTYLSTGSNTSLTELHAPGPYCTITHKVS
jgi:hypothetical protein